MTTSFQSPLLWVPVKHTDDVDIASAVQLSISSSYGEDPKKYSSSLQALARARTDAVRGAASSDNTTRDLLFKWFHILEMLEVRFPEIRVPFTWKDAFTGKAISQYSLAYEKAGVIFNTAATLSSIAASTSRLGGNSSSSSSSSSSAPSTSPSTPPLPLPSAATDSDGTKRAYTALRQSAGFFSYISDNFLHAPSTDMSRQLLAFIVLLLLTQANEVFLEKTLAGKSSPSLVAKLAKSVANQYHTLSNDSKEWMNKDVLDRTWNLLLTAKAKHFASLTQYYKAQADSAASQHGHCLVRLTLAEAAAKEAVKLANQFSSNHTSTGPSASAATTFGYTNPSTSAYTMPSDAGPSLVGITSTHLALVSEKRAQAVKDNDLIYHDILPSESALAPIDPVGPAQPISIQEVYASPDVQRVIGPDLFAKLIPLGVHERASMYSEEKAKLARAEGEKCDLAEGQRVATLDDLGLPASLQRYRTTSSSSQGSAPAWDSLADPGSQVMAWSDEEAAGGPSRGGDGLSPGPEGVQEALRRISTLRLAAKTDLDTASELLNEESRLCEKARVKHGHSFAQEPSGGQARVKELRADIKTNRDALLQAQDNDARIEAKWRDVQADVELLLQGRPALEQAFAEAVAASGSGADTTTSASSLSPAPPSLLDVSESDEQASSAAQTQLRADVEAIDAALVKLGKVKRERESLLAELREKLQSDDIAHLLIMSHRGGSKNASHSNGGSGGGNNGPDDVGGGGGESVGDNPAQAAQETALFRQELEKFKPWQTRLSQAVVAQGHLLAEVTARFSSLRSNPEGVKLSRTWEAKSRARQALVQRLRAARDGNAEVRAALGKGVKFYEDLGEIARGLRAGAREWSETRASERQRMEGEAEWAGKLSGEGGGGGGDGGAGIDSLDRSVGSMGLGSGGAGSGGPPPPALPPQRQSSGAFSPAPAPAPQPPTRQYSLSGLTSPGASASANPAPHQSYPHPPAQPQPQTQTQHSTYASPSPALPPPPPRPQQGSYALYGTSAAPYAPPPPQQPQRQASYGASTPGGSSATTTGGLPPPPLPASSYGGYAVPQPASYASPSPSPGPGPASPYAGQYAYHGQAQGQPAAGTGSGSSSTYAYAYTPHQQAGSYTYGYGAGSGSVGGGYGYSGQVQQQGQGPYGQVAPPPPPGQPQAPSGGYAHVGHVQGYAPPPPAPPSMPHGQGQGPVQGQPQGQGQGYAPYGYGQAQGAPQGGSGSGSATGGGPFF